VQICVEMRSHRMRLEAHLLSILSGRLLYVLLSPIRGLWPIWGRIVLGRLYRRWLGILGRYVDAVPLWEWGHAGFRPTARTSEIVDDVEAVKLRSPLGFEASI
jgi:hypothetical protein